MKGKGPIDKVTRLAKKAEKAVGKVEKAKAVAKSGVKEVSTDKFMRLGKKAGNAVGKVEKAAIKGANKIVDKARKGKFNSASDMVSSYVKSKMK